MYVFAVDVPRGASAVEVDLSYLRRSPRQLHVRPSATANAVVVAWNTLILFPLGKSPDHIMMEGRSGFRRDGRRPGRCNRTSAPR